MNHSYRQRAMFLCTLMLFACTSFVHAQQPDALHQKLQQMQQAMSRNEQQLHSYQWIETATITIDGSSKPPRQSICRYTPDGMLSKTPLGPPPQMPVARGGPFRKMMVRKKVEAFQEELSQVRALTGMYLPPNREKLREAFEVNKVTFERNGEGGNAIVIHGYAKPGDELRLVLRPSTMQIQRIAVKTYLDKPKDALTADVEFSSLADGTTYPSITTIDVPSKRLSLTTVSSNFSKAIY